MRATTDRAGAFGSGSFTRERAGAAEQVLEDLRSKIYSGELEKGVRLPSEKELAVYYDVSAPTVSEAMRALKAMKLVESRHGSGTYVIAATSALMLEAFTAVVELENVDLESVLDLADVVYEKAVNLAITRATDADIVDLREAAERFRAQTHSTDEFAETLAHFLLTLVRISHNSLLIAMSEFLVQGHLTLARESALISPKMWNGIAQRLIDERLAVVDSLAERDAVAARAAVILYLERGRELIRANVT